MSTEPEVVAELRIVLDVRVAADGVDGAVPAVIEPVVDSCSRTHVSYRQ
jgi:hypothetical protein